MVAELKKVAQIARALSKANQPLLLSTIGNNGGPSSRYIGEFRIKDSGDIFLISPSNTRKIKEIKANPKAQLLFSAKDFQQVLTLEGRAFIVEDEALRRQIYEEKQPLKLYPRFDAFFAVIRFVPQRAEILNLKVSNDPIIIDMTHEQ